MGFEVILGDQYRPVVVPCTNSKKLKMDVTVPYQLITEAALMRKVPLYYINASLSGKKNLMTFNMLGMKCYLNVTRNKMFAGEGSRWFHKKNQQGADPRRAAV